MRSKELDLLIAKQYKGILANHRKAYEERADPFAAAWKALSERRADALALAWLCAGAM